MISRPRYLHQVFVVFYHIFGSGSRAKRKLTELRWSLVMKVAENRDNRCINQGVSEGKWCYVRCLSFIDELPLYTSAALLRLIGIAGFQSETSPRLGAGFLSAHPQ